MLFANESVLWIGSLFDVNVEKRVVYMIHFRIKCAAKERTLLTGFKNVYIKEVKKSKRVIVWRLFESVLWDDWSETICRYESFAVELHYKIHRHGIVMHLRKKNERKENGWKEEKNRSNDICERTLWVKDKSRLPNASRLHSSPSFPLFPEVMPFLLQCH